MSSRNQIYDYRAGALPLTRVKIADGQMNRPPRCLAAWGVAYFVVLGRTRALVDDFEEIIYVLLPLDMVTIADGPMNRPPRCLAT
ncbi:MAG: hypothetical protein ACKOAH_00550 [Pirellula sp.]